MAPLGVLRGSCVFTLLSLAALWCMGCSQTAATPCNTSKAVMAFVDKSKSAESDRRVAKLAMTKIVDSLRPGDSLVVGEISARSADDFASCIEFDLPKPLPPRNPMLDSELIYRKVVSARAGVDSTHIGALRVEVALLLDAPDDAGSTAIFQALAIAAQYFAVEVRERKVLVLLSDMIETSACNFRCVQIDDGYVSRQIESHRRLHLLPNLTGVTVYVAGAHGPTPERCAAIERFWREYMGAAGASVQYGRTLPRFVE